MTPRPDLRTAAEMLCGILDVEMRRSGKGYMLYVNGLHMCSAFEDSNRGHQFDQLKTALTELRAALDAEKEQSPCE